MTGRDSEGTDRRRHGEHGWSRLYPNCFRQQRGAKKDSFEELGVMVRTSCVARGCGQSTLATRGKRRTHLKAHFEFTRHSF